MIVDEQLIRLLKTNTLFRGVSLTILKPYFKPKNFFQANEGEVIFNSDSDPEELYLLVEGEVKLKFCQDRHIEIKYILDFFGEAEILKNCKRISIAIANTDCTLYKISASEIQFLAGENEIVNRNLRKLKVIGENKNQAGDDNYSGNLKDVNQVLTNAELMEKIELGNEEETKILTDVELDSILEKQKSRKEIHSVLKKITEVPEIDELDLED